MNLKNSYFFTLREDVKDEDSVSGNLLTRSGMIKKTSAGAYMFLPLGLRVMDNIKKIVKEEMDNAGAQELLMPSLIAAEVYDSCGRLEAFGNSMFHLRDRANHEMVLGPTHEELFTIAAKQMVRSYKDLPFNLYQQADKFRDEARPRYGLIRVKEFIMKDAYSFDRDEAGLDVSYQKMYQAYNNIYDRIGIDYKIVKASCGAMGGTLSEEYQAVTDIGEDILVLCDGCDYSANLEVAQAKYEESTEEHKEKELVHTPNVKTIQDVLDFLNLDIKKTVKALLMGAGEELVVFFVRGDRELNTDKAAALLGVDEIFFADDRLIATSNAVPGFTGCVDLNCKVVIDEEILTMSNFCCGGNKEDYHYINVNVEDIRYDVVGDIKNVVEGDTCPHCGGKFYFKKGIEIGNLFKLGTKYSEHLGLTYLDEENKENYVVMGCYGIGIGRILAAVVEQNNDEKGMILPMNIAPYQIAIVALNTNDEEQMKFANELHDNLTRKGISVLLDDREERAGVKFNDMDLIGIPVRVTIGKKFADGNVELKLRTEANATDVSINEIESKIEELVKELMK